MGGAHGGNPFGRAGGEDVRRAGGWAGGGAPPPSTGFFQSAVRAVWNTFAPSIRRMFFVAVGAFARRLVEAIIRRIFRR